jgi:formylaminopyrimidine deformylase / aminopyrimidine aminohydrolase
VTVAELVHGLSDEWRAATEHAFLAGVRDGTVSSATFDAWLVQDAHFVADLLRFQGHLLARAPRRAEPVLTAGAMGLVDELQRFGEQATARGLSLTAPRLAATDEYGMLLDRLDASDPAVALTALWALERVYLEAWTSAAPGAPEYRAFVAHWTSPAFATYVAELERVADALLADGTAVPADEITDVVGRVLSAERAFWDMAVRSA